MLERYSASSPLTATATGATETETIEHPANEYGSNPLIHSGSRTHGSSDLSSNSRTARYLHLYIRVIAEVLGARVAALSIWTRNAPGGGRLVFSCRPCSAGR